MLNIRDAIRIGAFDDILDDFWNLDNCLFQDLIVFDDIDGRIRREQGNLIDLFLCLSAAADLDEPFFAHLFAWKIEGNVDRMLVFLRIKQLHHPESGFARDVVYH